MWLILGPRKTFSCWVKLSRRLHSWWFSEKFDDDDDDVDDDDDDDDDDDEYFGQKLGTEFLLKQQPARLEYHTGSQASLCLIKMADTLSTRSG